MENSKVVRILQALEPEELRQLGKFLRSPVHNRREDVIRLFDYILGWLKGQRKSLQAPRVAKAVFGQAPEKMQPLHYVASYLLKVVEDFLAWREWHSDEVTRRYYLMRAYRKRHLDKPFRRTASQTRSAHDRQPLRDISYHYRRYQMMLEQYEQAHKLGRIAEFNLQELVYAQDTTFIAEKLKNACILLSHQAVTRKDYDTGFLPQVLQYLDSRPALLEVPAIALYYFSFKALSEVEEDHHFERLKALQRTHRRLFPLEELQSFYTIAINYCIRRINRGEERFLQEVFELYRSGLEEGVFLDRGIISPFTYTNIIFAGTRLNQYEWVEQFIHRYRKHLPPEQREDLFHYNLARFHYEKGDYERAMPLLQRIEYKDLLHNCVAKTMLAKMYYELQELDSLSSLLQSFSVFLYRAQKLGYHRENFLNFVRSLRRLLSLPPDRQAADRLRTRIQSTQRITEKNWLLQQLERVKI
ncbi:MAG: hypothetical protein D6765_16270 [Bacteroidetes bacterium]|nr:MAG: hypothetical protein D6765_16270 [Bacteroidota bacterium]